VFYEIRRYQIQPGRRDEWVRYMEETIIPFQTEQGMTIVGSFTDEEDDNAYVWIRRFDDEDQRVALYAAVYQSDRWREEISQVVGKLMIREKMVVTRVVPTAASGLR
jgi:hypothetical protein